MPMVATVIIRTWRAPSPEIRARDTSNDRTTNRSAGVNSGPNMDAGVNSAPDLGGRRCGDREDCGDTNYRKLAEHNVSLPWASYALLRSCPSATRGEALAYGVCCSPRTTGHGHELP